MKRTAKAASRRSATPRAHTRQKGDVVVPVKVLQLIDAVGVTRASKALGVSTTTLHKARPKAANPNPLVSRVIEIAAAAALRDLGGDRAPVDIAALTAHRATRAFLLEVDAAKGDTVKQFAAMVGGKLIAA